MTCRKIRSTSAARKACPAVRARFRGVDQAEVDDLQPRPHDLLPPLARGTPATAPRAPGTAASTRRARSRRGRSSAGRRRRGVGGSIKGLACRREASSPMVPHPCSRFAAGRMLQRLAVGDPRDRLATAQRQSPGNSVAGLIRRSRMLLVPPPPATRPGNSVAGLLALREGPIFPEPSRRRISPNRGRDPSRATRPRGRAAARGKAGPRAGGSVAGSCQRSQERAKRGAGVKRPSHPASPPTRTPHTCASLFNPL